MLAQSSSDASRIVTYHDISDGDADLIDDECSYRRNLRHCTISTVRRLGDQGRLSPRQKSVLLTSMIREIWSSQGRSDQSRTPLSPVEVAFELLIGVGEDIDACLDGTAADGSDVSLKDEQMMTLESRVEDFAQQCRVFADEIHT
eukprot:FR738416.1.p1 GENE.FR738416.1~~FR738416.1.p1  ORF type:complete len:169 (+),score=19.95 FR738416.1:75-509(+)